MATRPMQRHAASHDDSGGTAVVMSLTKGKATITWLMLQLLGPYRRGRRCGRLGLRSDRW